MPSIQDTSLLSTYAQKSLADSGVSTTNLVGYWKLDGNATDSSGNSYNLSGTTPTYITALFNQGGDFESTSTQYLAIANASCPNLEISGSQTWSCWYKPESLYNYAGVMGKNGATYLKDINVDSTGAVNFRLSGLSASVTSDVKMSTGSWFHIVGVFDSSAGKLKVFINGVKKEASVTGTATNTGGDFSVGRNGATSPSYADGVIDDAAVWSRALSDEEAAALYKAGGNCVGYWKLDQTEDTNTKLLLHFNGEDATTSTIESSTGKAVTFAGTAQIDTAQKKFGSSSLLLDGNSDYVTLVDSDDWSFGTGNFTIDCWVRFNSLSGQQIFVGQYTDGNNFWQFSKDTDNSIAIFFKSGGTVRGHYYTGASAVTDTNTWYHLTLVRNSTNVYIFVNGESKALTVGTAISTNDVGNVASVLYIGQLASNFYVNGWIDELRIVKGVAKWTANFTPPTEPYSFQNDDWSSNGSHGTLANITNTTGLYGQAAQYNGTSSKITLNPYNPGTTSVTLSCWAIVDVQTTNYPQIFLDGSTTLSFNLASYGTAYAAGDRQKVIFFGTNTAGTTVNSSVTGQMNDGLWHHYAGVVNTATGKIALYLDGVLVGAEQTFTGTLKIPAGAMFIGTGDVPGSVNQWFKGTIDDVAVFNRALTSNEIYQIYSGFTPKINFI